MLVCRIIFTYLSKMFAMFTCSFVDSLTLTSPLFSTQLTILFDFYHYRKHTDKAHIFEYLIK